MDMDIRVVIQREKRGHRVRSWDFRDDIDVFFEGKGSLWKALMYCTGNRLTVVNARGIKKVKA